MTAQLSYPSLKQCYIYTKNSCCTNLHDEAITAALEALISTNCVDNYDDIIQYFCFGCNQNQALSVNEAARTITICSDFAARIWTGGNSDPLQLSIKQDTYDDCGLKIGDSIVIQSNAFKNATAFFNAVKPPFFENYTVIISNTAYCYDAASTLSGVVFALALLLVSVML